MSEETVNYTALPEDLEPLPSKTRGPQNSPTPLATFVNSGILLNKAAQEMLHNPDRIDITFGARSRMVALRPSRDGSGHRCSRIGQRGAAIRIGIWRALERLGLEPQRKGFPLRLPAHLVDGALLIGPLPEAKS